MEDVAKEKAVEEGEEEEESGSSSGAGEEPEQQPEEQPAAAVETEQVKEEEAQEAEESKPVEDEAQPVKAAEEKAEQEQEEPEKPAQKEQEQPEKPAQKEQAGQKKDEADGDGAAANGLPFTGALEEEEAPTAPAAAVLSDAPLAPPPAGTAIQKGPGGGEGAGGVLPYSGVETAAGAKHVGRPAAPVQEESGCCCIS